MKRYFIYPLFLIITCIVYRNIPGNQFLDDSLSGIVSFNAQGWSGLKDSFGFTSIYYGHDLIYFGFYNLFGLNNLAWFILFTSIHALNAFIGFKFLKKILERRHIKHDFEIAFCAALLFLLSPYQTENVVWGATMHYLFSMLFLWTGFFLYNRFLNTKQIVPLICFWLIFAFSLTTLEISLVFPAIYFVVFAFLWNIEIDKKQIYLHFRNIVLPMFLIETGYFILNKNVHGMYIGHYESKTHLQTLFSLQSVTTIEQYFAKFFGYIHFFPYDLRDKIYGLFEIDIITIGLPVLLMLLLVSAYKKRKEEVKLIYLILLLAIICLIPVCSMYFMYLNQVNNDRLSYFSSFFMSFLLVYFMSLFGKKTFITGAIIIACLNLFLLSGYIVRWEQAAEIQRKACVTFQWADAENVYILNQPCYYKGVCVFRNKERLERALKIFRNIDMQDSIHEIAWANMNSPEDDISLKGNVNDTIELTLNEWGRWFWYNNKGAEDYANETAQVNFDNWNHSYKLVFNKPPGDKDVIIYFTRSGWKKLN